MSEKFSYSVTLTDSYVRTLGASETTGTKTPYNYNVVRPYFTLRYKPHDDHFFTFDYGRYYTKPNFTYLNPFRRYESPVYYVEGNPNLKPCLYDAVTFKYRYRYWLNFAVSYMHVADYVLQVPQLDADGAIIGYTYGNFGKRNEVDFNLYVSQRLFDERLNLGVLADAKYTLCNSGDALDYRNSMWQYTGLLNFSYVLFPKYNVELGGYAMYMSSFLEGFSVMEGYPTLDLHLSASFLDGNLIASLSVKDVFNSGMSNSESRLNGVISKSDNILDSRAIRLSVQYSFNRKKLEVFDNHQGNNDNGNRL